MNRSPRRLVPLVAWLAALIGAGLLLVDAGRVLPTPPTRPAAWPGWAATSDPVAVAFAMARVLGLAACAYLLVTTVLSLAAAASRVPRLLAAVDLVTLPGIRMLVRGALGAGLAASVAWSTPLAPALAQSDGRGTAVMHLIDEPRTTTSVPDTDRPTPTMVALPIEPSAPAPPPPSPPAEPAASPPATTWEIQPGDHLWRVAERTLAGTWERPPTDTETASYLHRLVELNVDRLAVPDHPDLVFPGQVFDLPAPPPR